MRSQEPQLAAYRLHTDDKREAIPPSPAPEIYQRKPITLPSSLRKPSLRAYFDWDDSGNEDYSKRPSLLDLFAGGGGAAMGYYLAGFRVTGVDIQPQPNYPFEFHRADALEFSLDRFDVVHASPPCQKYSKLAHLTTRNTPALIPELRGMLFDAGKPFIIENVVGAPLINPVVLCGTMFHLRTNCGASLQRHRLFETNWPLAALRCKHNGSPTIGIFGATPRNTALEKRHYSKKKDTRGHPPKGIVFPKKAAKKAMGIDWMTWSELKEAIPPVYTEFIGRQLIQILNANRQNSGKLNR